MNVVKKPLLEDISEEKRSTCSKSHIGSHSARILIDYDMKNNNNMYMPLIVEISDVKNESHINYNDLAIKNSHSKKYVVINNCDHTVKNLENDLKLKGEPIVGSGINVKKVSGRLRIQILLSLFFFFVEFLTGIVSGSIALIADSYHMAADVMALIVAFICLRMANRESKSNSYGWVRAEALGGFFNGLFLLTVCLSIFQEAAGRIMNPRIIGKPLHVLVVGIVGLLINVIGLILLNGQGHGHSHGGGGHGHSHGGGHGHSHGGGHGHSHEHHSKEKNKEKCSNAIKIKKSEKDDALLSKCDTEVSPLPEIRASRSNTSFSMERRFTGPGVPYATRMASELLDDEIEEGLNEEVLEEKQKMKKSKNVNIHGVYLHLMSDAFGSIIVIITAGFVHFFPEWEWTVYFDPVLSLCLASMISFSAFGLVRESINILLMKPPTGINNETVKNDLTKIAGVASVTDMDIWSLTGSRLIASARINFCHPAIFADAIFTIRKYFHDLGIHSTTIEPTFETKCMETMKIAMEECSSNEKCSYKSQALNETNIDPHDA